MTWNAVMTNYSEWFETNDEKFLLDVDKHCHEAKLFFPNVSRSLVAFFNSRFSYINC